MRTEKQKQAGNRNFTLMLLSGIMHNLKKSKIVCNDPILKKEFDKAITHLEYIQILCEESTTSDWNSYEPRQT